MELKEPFQITNINSVTLEDVVWDLEDQITKNSIYIGTSLSAIALYPREIIKIIDSLDKKYAKTFVLSDLKLPTKTGSEDIGVVLAVQKTRAIQMQIESWDT